jgi:transposase
MSRRIYIDESGISRFRYRERARALRGKRVYGLARGRRFARTNIAAGYRDGKILGEYCYGGSTSAAVFEDWFCAFLLPETRKGDVIIMDNASFHNKKRLRNYARIYKVDIIFLPPYSPDYNPIEHVWANLKRYLRDYWDKTLSLTYAIYWYFTTACY